jgi:type I restriction enzyme S subunit
MNVQATEKAFAVQFSALYRWDPPSFHRIKWHWPDSVLRPIGSFLNPRKEKVDSKRFAFADLQPITIHLDGSIDRRDVDNGRVYSMDLFFAHPGDIVVAKIDLKNGAVGIVPNWKNVVVTNHFALYEPDRDLIVPEYFLLLFRQRSSKRICGEIKSVPKAAKK